MAEHKKINPNRRYLMASHIDLTREKGDAPIMDNVTVLSRIAFSALSRAFLLFAVAALAMTDAAYAKNTKYAAFVVHADSGDILFDRYSTQPRYPASLTKMMTLYLLFEELEAGRITLKSKLKVSKNAAAQPPSKLGVTAGSTITAETAIKALIVKSANDVAVVVAEKIGKTEWQFAKRMTQRARQIGMRNTTFKNASGLPNSRQLTTARDMAELSRRLFQDFPQYKHYFTTKQFTWKKRTFTTHNSLVKNYQGADGIKTGYTRRSGFNLATHATRNNEKLIGIVLGGRSSYTRDKHMREIMDNAFASITRKPQLISALHRNTPTPTLKPSPYDEAPTIADNIILQAEIAGAARSFNGGSNSTDTLGSLIASNAAADSSGLASTTELNKAEFDRLAQLIQREDNSYGTGEGDIDDARSLAATITSTPVPLNWTVQIGAYSTEDYAASELEKAVSLAGIERTPRRVIPLLVDNRPTLYRARLFYRTRTDAISECEKLRASGIGCFVTSDPANAS